MELNSLLADGNDPDLECTGCGWTGYTEDMTDGEQCPNCGESDFIQPVIFDEEG